MTIILMILGFLHVLHAFIAAVITPPPAYVAPRVLHIPLVFNEYAGYKIKVRFGKTLAECTLDTGSRYVTVMHRLEHRMVLEDFFVTGASKGIGVEGVVFDVVQANSNLSFPGINEQWTSQTTLNHFPGDTDCLLGMSFLRLFKTFQIEKETPGHSAELLLVE